MLGALEVIGLLIVKKTMVIVLILWLKKIGIDIVLLSLTPPVAFLLILLFLFILSIAFSRWAFRSGNQKERVSEAYSCGEDFEEHLIQPDYSQFFPYAFFFTILHVVALVVATAPIENVKVFVIAIIYILVAVMGLTTLLRRES